MAAVSTYNANNGEGSSTSSSGHPSDPFDDDDDSDDERDFHDPAVAHAAEQALLEDDFLLPQTQNANVSKGKQTLVNRINLSALDDSTQFSANSSRIRRLRGNANRAGIDIPLAGLEKNGEQATQSSSLKEDHGMLDWYSNGIRRGVGYDDLTAIDWVFEYTKERQRLRILQSKATTLIGYFQQLVDASQVWIVLISTGLAAGVLAAGIDVVSDWLGDLKSGYCKNGPGGGHFYLNKGFCCWGHTEWAQCSDWTLWSTALSLKSNVARYMVEYLFFICYSVLFATCASLLVSTYSIHAKHSGIPEIKTVLGGFVIRRFMGAWTLVVKSLGLCLATASGLWLGKEGPLVHVACCCASLLMKLSKNLNDNEARKREVLSAAASAGISVAFGSPIGGVLFSLEQLSYFFPDKTMWQSFVCAMVAAVTLQAFNPFRTGQLVLYQVTYSSSWHGFEMVPYALLGIVGGLYGASFIKLNMYIAKWRKTSALAGKPVLEVFAVALLTAVVNFPNVFMRAPSSELVYTMFAECAAIEDDQFGICKTGAAYASIITLLLLAALLGFGFAAVTFGLQVPAGIILPSMAIGALYGRALGIIMEIIQTNHPSSFIFRNCEPDIPCITPGTYAIIGAASALGGVTRMTVSIVVIMFELTGALTYVLPIMIAVMISKWVGDAFGKKGIYETWIHFNEYPFLDNRVDTPVPDIPVVELMTNIQDLITIKSSAHTLQTLQEFLSAHNFRGFPVIDGPGNTLLGYISRTELDFALTAALSEPNKLPLDTQVIFSQSRLDAAGQPIDLRPWMDQTPITLNSKSTLQLTLDMFQKLGLKYVLFCDRGSLQGLMTKKDIWYILNDAEYKKSENSELVTTSEH
ncbi:hypothetical protein MMC25_004245 [Agyrium rufum]|nr:hypothetical protein [Agyrium rufum]